MHENIDFLIWLGGLIIMIGAIVLFSIHWLGFVIAFVGLACIVIGLIARHTT